MKSEYLTAPVGIFLNLRIAYPALYYFSAENWCDVKRLLLLCAMVIVTEFTLRHFSKVSVSPFTYFIIMRAQWLGLHGLWVKSLYLQTLLYCSLWQVHTGVLSEA